MIFRSQAWAKIYSFLKKSKETSPLRPIVSLSAHPCLSLLCYHLTIVEFNSHFLHHSLFPYDTVERTLMKSRYRKTGSFILSENLLFWKVQLWVNPSYFIPQFSSSVPLMSVSTSKCILKLWMKICSSMAFNFKNYYFSFLTGSFLSGICQKCRLSMSLN